MVELKEECKQTLCSNECMDFEECTNRVESKTQTSETCEQELHFLMKCYGHCVIFVCFFRLIYSWFFHLSMNKWI